MSLTNENDNNWNYEDIKYSWLSYVCGNSVYIDYHAYTHCQDMTS